MELAGLFAEMNRDREAAEFSGLSNVEHGLGVASLTGADARSAGV
jgi:hypothetical protein